MTDQSFKNTDQQLEKSCQLFILKISNTQHYQTIYNFMKDFRTDQNKVNALNVFIHLHQYIKSTQNKSLQDQFNKCLVPQAFRKDEGKQKPKSSQNLNVNMRNTDLVPSQPLVTYSRPPQPAYHYHQDINQQIFMKRLHGLPNFNLFGKVVQLYLKCIITLTQLQQFTIQILPKNVYKYFIRLASSIQSARRKGSLFVSLNQLSESQLKNRIGASYVQMPDGYANHCNDHTLPNHVRKTLNRQWVSMPLGTQFKNMKKNQYEQQMFKLEQDRFEIDITIINFRKCIDHIKDIQKSRIFKQSSMLERTLFRIYGSVQAFDSLKRNPQDFCQIILYRLQQKLRQIQNCRKKAIKGWQQSAIKNFQKSLDHRSYYFQTYQKKFNLNVSRWDKQTQFRHQLYINSQTPNPQNYNTNINMTVDTFQNVTRKKCIQSKIVNLSFPPSKSFINFPQNKVLYIFDFQNKDIFSDVIGIINSKVNKKSTFQYLLLKMMQVDLSKAIQDFEDRLKKFRKFKQTNEVLKNNNDSYDEDDYLATKKDRKKAPDMNEQFLQLIEQDLQYMSYKQTQSPFEGPLGNVFIGTKSHYHFIRYILVIYQRFIKAKEVINAMQNQQKQSPLFLLGQRYDKFKNILMNKSKDINLDDYFRKIFEKNAFLFLTLNKLIEKVAKIINNPDNISNSIIKADTKYYDSKIKSIESFEPKPQIQQIMRVYHEQGVFYRFCWDSPLLYISSWNSAYKQWHNISQNLIRFNDNFSSFTTNPVQKIKSKSDVVKKQSGKKRQLQQVHSQYVTAPNDMLLLQKGQQFYYNLNSRSKFVNTFDQELKRVKRVKEILNM